MSAEPSEKANSKGDAEAPPSPGREFQLSPRSKGLREAGPFGDSPTERASDCYVLMMQEEDDYSTDDDTIDDLKSRYYQKLDVIRRKLQLLQVPNESKATCTIRELTEEEYQSSRISSEKTCKGEPEDLDEVELETIFDYSRTYSLTSSDSSSSCLFDVDYNPPKKKHCFRDKTPRISAVASEGNTQFQNQARRDVFYKPGKIGNRSFKPCGDHVFPEVIVENKSQESKLDAECKPMNIKYAFGEAIDKTSNLFRVGSAASSSKHEIGVEKSTKSTPRSKSSLSKNKVEPTENLTKFQEVFTIASPGKEGKKHLSDSEEEAAFSSVLIREAKKANQSEFGSKTYPPKCPIERSGDFPSLTKISKLFKKSKRSKPPQPRNLIKKESCPEVVKIEDIVSDTDVNRLVPTNLTLAFKKQQEVRHECYYPPGYFDDLSTEGSNANENMERRFDWKKWFCPCFSDR